MVNVDVWVMSADGTGVSRLTSHWARDDSPRWSPDGHRLAFLSNRAGLPQEIFTMDADGSNVSRVTRLVEGSGSADPVWSPDARLIAFTADMSRGLFVVSEDGSTLRRLTVPELDKRFPEVVDRSPAWKR